MTKTRTFRPFKKTLLATLITGACIHAGVSAQETDVPDNDEVEKIEVSGIRSSLFSARELKKDNDTISDVIALEDIGKLPDVNVAETLSRLPGFSVDRQFGEGEKVSIHGTDPALNRIFIDGHAIASADWGGNPNDVSGRTFNYAMLAPEIIGQARVFKNPEAWIDEGSVGGTVLIDTRKPFDLDANTFSASVGYSYNDRSEKGNGRYSALYSWKNDDETFGVLLSAQYDKKTLYRAGIEYFGYSGGNIFANAFDTTTDAEGNVTGVTGANINGAAPTVESYNELMDARVPCCINFAFFNQERERLGLNGALQWKPSDDSEITFTTMQIYGDYTNFNQSEYTAASWVGGDATDLTVNQGIVTSGTIAGTSSNSAQLDPIYRESEVDTESYNLAGKWTNDIWKVSGNVGYTKATGGKSPEYQTNFHHQGGYSFEFDQSHTFQQYVADPSDPTTFSRTDLTEMTVNGVTDDYLQIGVIADLLYNDEETYGQIDFEYNVASGFFTKVLFGAKASTHKNWVDASSTRVYLTEATDLSDWDWTLSPSSLWDGLGAGGNSTQYAILTKDGILDMMNSGVQGPLEYNYGSQFEVKEDVVAGYLQGNFEWEDFKGNVGVRVVRTEDVSDFWQYDSDSQTWSAESISNSYTKALPSINVVYSVTEDFLLKAGAAKVIARPRYSDLAGAFELSDTTLTGGGGNPDLKPYESTNYEMSAEYYFRETDMVAAEIFFRDVSSYIVTDTTEQELYNTLTGNTGTYFISSPINAEAAKVYGLALQGQFDLGWGFGIATNATFADADVPSNEYYMPYLSDLTVNVTPYYEKGPLQLRLNYGYRSEYFTQIGRLASQDYTASYTQLDFSGTYEWSENLSFTVQASNLLDETYYQYSSVTIAPTSFYKNGRQFSLGASFNF